MKLLSEKLTGLIGETQHNETPTLYDDVIVKDGSDCESIYYGLTGQIEGKHDGKFLVNFDNPPKHAGSDDEIQNVYLDVTCLQKIGGLAERLLSTTKEDVTVKEATLDNLKQAATDARTIEHKNWDSIVFTVKKNVYKKYKKELPRGYEPIFVPVEAYYQSSFFGAPIGEDKNAEWDNPTPVDLEDIDKLYYGVLPHLGDSMVWNLYESSTDDSKPNLGQDLYEGFTDEQLSDLQQMVCEAEGNLHKFLTLPILENKNQISRRHRTQPFEHILVIKGDDKFIIAESKYFKRAEHESDGLSCGTLGSDNVVFENQVDILAGYDRGDSTYVIEVNTIDGVSATPFDQQNDIEETTHFKDIAKDSPNTFFVGLYNTFNRLFKIIYVSPQMNKRYHIFTEFVEGYGDEDKIENTGREVGKSKKPMMVRLGGLDIDEITKQMY